MASIRFTRKEWVCVHCGKPIKKASLCVMENGQRRHLFQKGTTQCREDLDQTNTQIGGIK